MRAWTDHRYSINSILHPPTLDPSLQVVLSCTQDEFFARNRNANFGDLGVAVKGASSLPCFLLTIWMTPMYVWVLADIPLLIHALWTAQYARRATGRLPAAGQAQREHPVHRGHAEVPRAVRFVFFSSCVVRSYAFFLNRLGLHPNPGPTPKTKKIQLPHFPFPSPQRLQARGHHVGARPPRREGEPPGHLAVRAGACVCSMDANMESKGVVHSMEAWIASSL